MKSKRKGDALVGKYYNNRPTSKLEQIRDSALKIHDRIDPGHDIISHDEGEPGYYNDRPKTKLETIRNAAECIAQITENPTGEYQYDELRNVDVASFVSQVTAHIKKLTVGIEPVQAGSGNPSPDNVRPITGWTGAKVTRCGKNLFPNAGDVTAIPDRRFFYSQPIILKGQTVTLSASSVEFGGEDKASVVMLLNKNNGGVTHISFTVTENGGSWTATEDIYGLDFISTSQPITSPGVRTIYRNVQLELGSTATDYEPYTGETYSVEFPSQAGTVYGGTLDLTAGTLTVDRAMIASYAGEALPSGWISDRDVYAAGTAPTTGAQVVYELSSPATYQLTPTEITTLLGENNVWADTGEIVRIKYLYAEI